jgi:hypothetical protein
MTRRLLRALCAAFLLAVAVPAAAQQAQEPPPTAPQEPQPVPPAAQPEIELNITNLPTTRSLRRHQSYFRLTHRFARDLRQGDFGQLAEDLFSLDNGAIIGLEYRFGITGNLQAGVHRSLLEKTIQMSGKYDRWRQGGRMPVSISVLTSIEGLNNFQENFQPSLVSSVSRVVESWLVLYATPGFVWNTRDADPIASHSHGEGDEHAGHEHTAFIGLGGRGRLRPTVFITGEISPRLAGHDPGRAAWSVAIEKMTKGGGHTLQLNFSNTFGTTFGQIARGGSEHDVYLGFNITRKF